MILIVLEIAHKMQYSFWIVGLILVAQINSKDQERKILVDFDPLKNKFVKKIWSPRRRIICACAPRRGLPTVKKSKAKSQV